MKLFKRGGTERPEVTIGCPVYTADHQDLGSVKELREGAFRIDVPMGRDYWIADSHVQTINESELILDFQKDWLDQYKLDDAPDFTESHKEPIENEYLSQAHGSIISDEEQMQMRERMERELAEQRRKLHEN
jgi:hypothetical protein